MFFNQKGYDVNSFYLAPTSSRACSNERNVPVTGQRFIHRSHFIFYWGGIWEFTSVWHLLPNEAEIAGMGSLLDANWPLLAEALSSILSFYPYLLVISSWGNDVQIVSLVMKGGIQTSCPQPQVIIPSAAFGGAIISFVLCPSELVKVSRLHFLGEVELSWESVSMLLLCYSNIASLQCRMQVQGADSLLPKSSRYSSPLDCAIKTVKAEGVS